MAIVVHWAWAMFCRGICWSSEVALRPCVRARRGTSVCWSIFLRLRLPDAPGDEPTAKERRSDQNEYAWCCD